MKQFILQFVPETWHMFYHQNVCLRLGLPGEVSVGIGGLIVVSLVAILIKARG